MKGLEPFGKEGGTEALLQVRTSYVSQDGRAERDWSYWFDPLDWA